LTLAIDPQEELQLAERVLTGKQFVVWELVERRGMTQRQVAVFLGKDHSTVREQFRTSERKLREYGRSEVARRDEPEVDLEQDVDWTVRAAVALLIQRDGPFCYLCRCELPASRLEVEHVVPRSAGGTDAAENLALACSPCNLKKGLRFVAFLAASRRPVYYAAERPE
jgi:hypothetical protein